MLYNVPISFGAIQKMGHFKTTLHILAQNGNDVLDLVASPYCAFDFSKIVALPNGHELIGNEQNNEAIYYFLTDRMTRPLASFEYNMYFVLCKIPDLMAPSLNNIIAFTVNYLNKFNEDGTFNKEVHAGYYPFPHESLDQLYETGRKLVDMINKYNINNLSYWKYQHWGSYTNALCSKRIDSHTVSFETMSDQSLKIVKKLIKDHSLSCTVKMESWITKETLADLVFVDGVISHSKAA